MSRQPDDPDPYYEAYCEGIVTEREENVRLIRQIGLDYARLTGSGCIETQTLEYVAGVIERKARDPKGQHGFTLKAMGLE